MKMLNAINTSAFANCTINEFDAPNLKTITVDANKYIAKKCSFSVGAKNFKDSPGILQKVDCPNEEPDY